MNYGYLLGIDVGTSATKVALYDFKLTLIDSFSQGYEVETPHPGWSEQHPDIWWEATKACIIKPSKKHNIKLIKSIGITGQMHGLVLLDLDGKPLRPSIIWCDQRSAVECNEITKLVGKKRLIDITANPALSGFTASKIRWIAKHEPDIFARCSHILLPKDYIRYKLSGMFATDMSDASGTQLLDITNRCWSPEMLSILNIKEDQLPKLFEGPQICSFVNEEASQEIGLEIGTPIVAGAGDQAASAIGSGIIQEGAISLTIGSSGVLFATTKKPLIENKGRYNTFCHALPNLWHVMSVTQGAGASLKWFKDQFCDVEIAEAKQKNIDVYDLLSLRASKIPLGSDGVIFLPYINGERSPHLNPHARGIFFGLSSFHNKDHMLRAVFEGISFSLFECFEVMKSNGLLAERLIVAGGGARSDFWMQILADVFTIPMARTDVSDAGTLGCAILAGLGIGVFSSPLEAIKQRIKITSVIYPLDNLKRPYDFVYRKFCKIYKQMKPLF